MQDFRRNPNSPLSLARLDIDVIEEMQLDEELASYARD